MLVVHNMDYLELEGLLSSVSYPYLTSDSPKDILKFYRCSPERNHLLLWAASKLTGNVSYLMPADEDKTILEVADLFEKLRYLNAENKLKFIKGTMKKCEQIVIWKKAIKYIKFRIEYILPLPDSPSENINVTEDQITSEKVFLADERTQTGCIVDSTISPKPGFIEEDTESPAFSKTCKTSPLSHVERLELEMENLRNSIGIMRDFRMELEKCNSFYDNSSLKELPKSNVIQALRAGVSVHPTDIFTELNPYLDTLTKFADEMKPLEELCIEAKKLNISVSEYFEIAKEL